MNFRRLSSALFLFIIIIIGNVVIRAQPATEVLATGGGMTFTPADLTRSARAAYDVWKQVDTTMRAEELEILISDTLLEEEAKSRKIAVEKLLEEEMSKRVANPTEAQVKALFDTNRSQIGNRSLDEVRPQIVEFLRQDAEQKAFLALIDELKKKIKVTPGVDVNLPTLKPTDVLSTVGSQKILAGEFNDKTKPTIFMKAFQAHRQLVHGLEDVIYNSLVLTESRNLKIESNELIAREITNKYVDYTDAEQVRLETALRDKLFKKYDVKILVPEPEPPVQNISTDDDPSIGNPKAPVTIVMFTDLQCSGCAATHPIIKEVMQSYGDKVRLVVRDFPLSEIHADAQKAAEAAAAAHAQGKFFEYIEILYKNQHLQDNASLKKYATQLGLNRAKFDADLDKGVFAAEVAKDLADGIAYSVRGTPTIFVNGMRAGMNSPELFKKLIDKALAQKPAANQ